VVTKKQISEMVYELTLDEQIKQLVEWDPSINPFYLQKENRMSQLGWDINDEPSQEPYVCSEAARRILKLTEAPPVPKKKRTYASYLAKLRQQPKKPRNTKPKRGKQAEEQPKEPAPPIPAWALKNPPPPQPTPPEPKPTTRKKKAATGKPPAAATTMARAKTVTTATTTSNSKPPPRPPSPITTPGCDSPGSTSSQVASMSPIKPSVAPAKRVARKPLAAKLPLGSCKKGSKTKPPGAKKPRKQRAKKPPKYEYEPLEDRRVYRPPGYDPNAGKPYGGSFHCVWCNLKPCITIKHNDEVEEHLKFLREMSSTQVGLDDDDRLGAMRMLVMHRCSALGEPYRSNSMIEPPGCIVDFVNRAAAPFPMWDSDDDDDSIFDDFPYSVMRDRQPGDPPSKYLLENYTRKQIESRSWVQLEEKRMQPESWQKQKDGAMDLITQDDINENDLFSQYLPFRARPNRVSFDSQRGVDGASDSEEEFHWAMTQEPA
jgi:hypothetical protein